MRRVTIVLAVGGFLLLLLLLSTDPPANADLGGSAVGPGSCDYPGVGTFGTTLGADWYYCDFPVEENGSHWHCEYGGWSIGGVGTYMRGMLSGGIVGTIGGHGGDCQWRWPDNTQAPAPNPPGAWKDHIVPKPVPVEHRAPPQQYEPEDELPNLATPPGECTPPPSENNPTPLPGMPPVGLAHPWAPGPSCPPPEVPAENPAAGNTEEPNIVNPAAPNPAQTRPEPHR